MTKSHNQAQYAKEVIVSFLATADRATGRAFGAPVVALLDEMLYERAALRHDPYDLAHLAAVLETQANLLAGCSPLHAQALMDARFALS